MKRHVYFVALLSFPLLAQKQDAQVLVRQSVDNYMHDAREALKWRWVQKDVMRKDGGTLTEISDIAPLFGTPYERLVSRDGELSDEQKSREEEKFAKAAQERENESPEKRAARLRKYEADRSFLKEIPEGYDFKIVGEPVINGRPAWQMEMTPRPGYVPKNSRAAMLKHIRGTLWIDKEDVRWVKAHAEVMSSISIGWIVARVGPGAKFDLEQTRVAPKFWVTKTIDVAAKAKVMMLHDKDLTEHLSYSDYRLATPGSPDARSKVPTTISKTRPKRQPTPCRGCGQPPSSALVPF